MFIALVIILISTVIAFDYCLKKKRLDMTLNIPGPMFIPIIGTSLVFQNRSEIGVMGFFRKVSTKYGPIVRIWLFNHLVIFIKTPELIEVILSSTKHTNKNFFRKFLAPLFDDGLLVSNGQKWFNRRKMIAPTFHIKMLEQFVDVFERQSEIMVKQMEKHLDGKEFNVNGYVSLASLDITCETSMATPINAQKNSGGEYCQALTDFCMMLTERTSCSWFLIDSIFKLFGFEMATRLKRALKVTKQFTNHVIEERRRLYNAADNTMNASSQKAPGNKQKPALLDVLLQSPFNGELLSNSDIQAEVNLFFAAGRDASANAISFTLYLLSRHPEVQSKVFLEICEVINSDKNSTAAYSDLQNLKYLDCVIKESLRMFPVVGIVARLITEDTKAGDYIWPAGTSIVIPIFQLMEDPQLFPEPEKFKPERHFPENMPANMNPYTFIPFSAGPRNCIGQKYSILHMKSAISKVLRHYELLPLGPDPIPTMKVFLVSLNGMHIGIKAR